MSKKLMKWNDKILCAKSPVCLVGYGFNAAAGMPHFSDVIRGVWARNDAQLNPFNSAENYRHVMNWFVCRRILIKANRHSEAYRALQDLKMAMQLTVATQCIDGLAGLNGVHAEYELYGNVFQAKCHACSHTDESFPIEADMDRDVCPICGGRYFPNVSMFGWNVREEIHSELIHKLSESDCIFLLGADKTLPPLTQSNSWRRNNQQLVGITKNQITVLESGEKSVFSPRDIATYLREKKVESELIDKLAKTDEKAGFDEMLRLVRACYGAK